ncbi:MAG TPA: LL-diaminopimelate aminotransferase [Phycisphaerales bacterium]|nr:LL-diaminopimelate aminotransferase [Phycisphaerales bacterium]HMP38438.1 LL-diaminopimelate aminotransferase [Phycisphaerales bacterium]
MAFINEHYLRLQAGYLFPEIARRVSEYAAAHPDRAPQIIRCGIGDVTEPLPEESRGAMHAAVDELARHETFRGYGPPFGNESLRHTIARSDFRERGIEVADDEIFVSDGSKGDCGAILDIFAAGRNRIAIADPVYPVYVDTNVMAGNTGPARAGGGYEGIIYLEGTPENGFVAPPPEEPADLIYLCFPNNPTGAVASREQLGEWVERALRWNAIILFDAAYEAYIVDPAIPRSIYEIPGARDCAIEFRSFSKNGGFTGVRCGFTVCPKSLRGGTGDGRTIALHDLWSRRWSTKSNGVSYPVQRGAEALYGERGRAQVRALVQFYLGNAALLREGVAALGLRAWGGINAPYVWVECPPGVDSWGVFDRLLAEANVVVTPGSGFGRRGEGFFRISAFNSRRNVEEVVRRLRAVAW